KPADPRQLTGYYLTMSVGGFAGSLVISGLFPLVTKWIVEYPAALALTALATALAERDAMAGWRAAILHATGSWKRVAVVAGCAVVALVAVPAGVEAAVGSAPAVLLGAVLL